MILMNDQRSSDAITLATVNEKGGVTKTTSTANLAVMLSRLGLRVLTVNALCASQSIIVPLIPEVLSVQGLGDLLQVVHQVQDDAINPDLTVAGIVFAKVQKYKGHQEIIRALRGDLSKEYEVSC